MEIANSCSSNIVWIKFDKSVFFNISKDLYPVYFPSVNSLKSNNQGNTNEIWYELEESILKYNDNNYIAIIGDLNCRIGNCNERLDYSSQIDAASELHVGDHKRDSLNSRNSRDAFKNKLGGKLTELCCHNDLVILSSRSLGDLQGQYNEKIEIYPVSIDSLDKPVTKSELLKVIKNIKVGKAYEEDLITNNLIKASVNFLEETMVNLFNVFRLL